MQPITAHVERLAQMDAWTYRASRSSAAEPAALAAIALAAHNMAAAAGRPAQWLANNQQSNGAVGVTKVELDPHWPTGLAMLAWQAADRAAGTTRFRAHVRRAAAWCLETHGKTAPRSSDIGHDTTIAGWSWAAGTSSWLEPTCYFVLGLTAAGFGEHQRVDDGVRLIVDRLLPNGGANYGNTIVLGQELLPHLAPSGLAMAAIAGRGLTDGRIDRSLNYLAQSAESCTAPVSLSWACIGLAAHGRRPKRADQWIESTLSGGAHLSLAAYELSLLLLAARHTVEWLAWRRRPAMRRSAT